MRPLYTVAGLLFVGLGWIGLVTPGLPGTVFFVSAAWCFSRSSPRLERWVLNLPGVGPMVSDYRDGLGMPRRAKIIAVSCIVAACVFSAGFAIDTTWVRITIAVLGAVGVWFVGIHIPTSERIRAERASNAAESGVAGLKATDSSARPR